MNSGVTALLILAAVVVLFATESIPVPVTAVSGALAMGLFGVISFHDAVSGFANDVTMMVIGGMMVGTTLFETGVAQMLGNYIIKKIGLNERGFLIACVIASSILSAFLSNTAVVAMMLPMIDAIAASSGGSIKRKNIYMAVGFSANIGGGMTLVGSPPNAIGQGLLSNVGFETMGVFDLLWASIPRFLFVILFYATIGYKLQNKAFDFEDTVFTALDSTQTEAKKQSPKYMAKMVISSLILVCMVAGFASQVWTAGTVALLSGLMCIWTKCVTVKQVFSHMDWGVVWTLAGSLGIAAGINQSGAGVLLANAVIDWFGGSVSLFLLMVLFTVLSVIMGNLMSSSPSMAILGPIAINICNELGYNAKPVIMAIIWSLNLAFLSPVATPPVTMTLQGGYRFMDYPKVGGILLVGCLILTIICYPFLK